MLLDVQLIICIMVEDGHRHNLTKRCFHWFYNIVEYVGIRPPRLWLHYLSCSLSRESIHQLLHPVVHEHGGVIQELGVGDFLSVDEEAVGHQRVPVVEMAELHGDAVIVLKTHIEEQGGIELEIQQVTAQVLHVLFYDDLDDLAWVEKTKPNSAKLY